MSANASYQASKQQKEKMVTTLSILGLLVACFGAQLSRHPSPGLTEAQTCFL